MSLLKEINEIKSTEKELRSFAWVVGGVFTALGLLGWWRHKPLFVLWLSIGLPLLAAGVLFPKILRPVQKAWMTLALLMGWVMTRVILSILFFAVVTPIALISKLVGKEFLIFKFREPGVSSYWISRDKIQKNKTDYERQF